MYKLFKLKNYTEKGKLLSYPGEDILLAKFTAISTGLPSHISFLRTKPQLMLRSTYVE
jgi:hypothetical protein